MYQTASPQPFKDSLTSSKGSVSPSVARRETASKGYCPTARCCPGLGWEKQEAAGQPAPSCEARQAEDAQAFVLSPRSGIWLRSKEVARSQHRAGHVASSRVECRRRRAESCLSAQAKARLGSLLLVLQLHFLSGSTAFGRLVRALFFLLFFVGGPGLLILLYSIFTSYLWSDDRATTLARNASSQLQKISIRQPALEI
jgi:hypothetical protein